MMCCCRAACLSSKPDPSMLLLPLLLSSSHQNHPDLFARHPPLQVLISTRLGQFPCSQDTYCVATIRLTMKMCKKIIIEVRKR